MKEIKQLVQDLNRYFVDKILNEDYVIVGTDEYKVAVKIDDTYIFSLWSTNAPVNLKCVEYTFDYFSSSSFMDLFFSQEEKEIIHSRFAQLIEQKRLKNKKEALEKLKQELNEN